KDYVEDIIKQQLKKSANSNNSNNSPTMSNLNKSWSSNYFSTTIGGAGAQTQTLNASKSQGRAGRGAAAQVQNKQMGGLQQQLHGPGGMLKSKFATVAQKTATVNATAQKFVQAGTGGGASGAAVAGTTVVVQQPLPRRKKLNFDTSALDGSSAVSGASGGPHTIRGGFVQQTYSSKASRKSMKNAGGAPNTSSQASPQGGSSSSTKPL
ncbi:unnamed protein product, partial [Amoebophrya sp. A120]